MKISLPTNSAMHQDDFIFGVATASFQIEGGVDYRLPCIWDTFCQQTGAIADQSNGDIACDHFNRWQEDIDIIEYLGVDAYRLSVSWPRVLKKDGAINQDGMNYYLAILQRLNEKGIKVFVTLYHWDLPQYLEDEGGWLNRDTAYKFADYVKQVVQAFGDSVYAYATLNEPFCSAYLGYEVGIHAPGLANVNYGKKAAHHLLLAHGLAMRVLKQYSPNTQNGIVLNFTPAYALTNSVKDISAAKYADDYFNHWYAKPILMGCYPDIIDQLPEQQRPDIYPDDMKIIAEKIDFLGINFYTRAVYQHHEDKIYEEIQMDGDKTDMGWEIVPQAFTDLLLDLNNRYNLPIVYITENGAAMKDQLVEGQVNDIDRIEYYNQHINAVSNAMEHGVDIQGYFAWSLMDNFEWALGYEKRFGLVYIDYQSQKRTIKVSGLAYRDLIIKS